MPSAPPMFTVFTATRNRAHLLPRVYESLKAQTYRGFEWVVVDDGSTDGTGELVRSWVAESPFPVRYFRQPHQGWHVAFNRAARESLAPYLNILDSDDRLPPHALERWREHWHAIPPERRVDYFAVLGLCSDPTGAVVGDRFPEDVFDTDHLEMRLRWRIRGDKAMSCRVEVARQYPYPEDLGRFVTASVILYRIAREYHIRCVNEVLKEVEYRADGLTANSVSHRAGSPAAARTSYGELARSGREIPSLMKFRVYSNLVRYCLHEGSGLGRPLREAPFSAWWLASYPTGFLAYLRDRWTLRFD